MKGVIIGMNLTQKNRIVLHTKFNIASYDIGRQVMVTNIDIQHKCNAVLKKYISFVETLPSNWMKAGFDYGLASEQLHESTVQHFILIKSYGNILITCERRVKI